MRRTLPNVGRGARSTGWDFGPHMDTDHAQAEIDAAAGIAVAREREEHQRAAPRIVHPVVRTSHDAWFRVIREYLSRDDGTCIEDIGEAPTFDAARRIAANEKGHARVLSPWARGKVRTLYDNGQEMEVRL